MSKKDKNALLQKSPAEFFADNKNIAGFDNVRWPASCRRDQAICYHILHSAVNSFNV